jgi:hypothetical protein
MSSTRLLCALAFGSILLVAPTTRAAEAPKKSAPRTLSDIQIEGEVDMPQVQFITARERYRTHDFHHRRYIKSFEQIGRAYRSTRRVSIVGSSVESAAKKEN